MCRHSGNVVVVGQARIVPSTAGAAAAAGSIRTTCSSTASPSPSKRKFQFQNNRTSPYEPQEVRHVQHLQLSGKDQDYVESHNAGGESPADPLTVHNDVSAADAPALKRPVELLHRRKIYVEGPRQLVGSSSSELSTAATNVNYRNRERPNDDTATSNGVALVEQQQQQQSNNSRQISPASCNSESVASSNVGTGSCGLCGLMPHCATLEGSARARKNRDTNTVIVEEETLPKVADRESGRARGGGCGAVAVVASSRTQQQQGGRGSHGQNRTAGAGESAGSATTVGKSHRMSKFNSSSMDRSVDSIGSCSLDVDADSTDFSGTAIRRLRRGFCGAATTSVQWRVGLV